jgi:ABC-2 type transport system permease protein
MTTTAVPGPTMTSASTGRPDDDRHATRSTLGDVRAVPTMLTSEWIKLSSVRSNKALLALTIGVDAFASWAVAKLVTDEVLTASEVFVYPTMLTAVFAAVAGILVFSSEVEHGTLATTLTAQPARWVVVLCKTTLAAAVGLALGVTGMAAGFGGAVVGGVELGDTSAMAATALWALLFTSLAAVIGLAVGMTVRHSAGAISGLLVWWLVAENLLTVFAPATVARLVPFGAGYRLLEVGSDLDTPEIVAAALTRPQNALVFAGYATVALIVATVMLHRQETS